MSDRAPDNEHEDILTGRRRRRQPESAQRGSGNQAASTEAGSDGPGRSRRRFTVDALFSDTRPQAVGVDDLTDAKQIRLDRILADPDQPRRSFDEARLEELVASISTEGVLQPIVVRYEPDGDTYIIVHGERRFRAAQRAGLDSIPAMVRDVPEERRLIQQLMENIVRDDLNAVDRARALKILKAQMHDAPWEDVAAEVGIRRSRLFQLLDTAKLPDTTQDRIRAGDLSEKQSRALQGLPATYQHALADAIVERAVPGPIAQRISRAIRGSQRQANTVIEATTHVGELLDIAIVAGDEARAAQIDHLLLLLGAAPGSPGIERDTLEEVATTLGAPRFSSARVTKSVGDLAQALAWADRTSVSDDRDLTKRLATLRDILDRMVSDS